MKLIKLSQGKFAKVDDEDFEYLNKFKWHVIGNQKDYFYAARNIKKDDGTRTIILMHRQIINPVGDLLIDHINGDTFDNQKNNLRIATRSQNNSNRRSQVGSRSKYLGVSFYKKTSKWVAFISYGGRNKNTHLGYYKTEQEAAKAYNDAALKYHGEFANLNKI